jgi:hypothetical protein
LWSPEWSIAYGFGVAAACVAAALPASLFFGWLFCNVLGALTVQPASDFDMFTAAWFRFHWVDMSLLALNSGEPAFFGESDLWSFFWRLTGAKVGSRVMVTDPFLCEPLLTSVGDGAVFDEGWAQPHVYSAHTLTIDTVAVGCGAELRDYACALLNASVGEGATLGADSLLMRGEVLPAGQTWQGVPALPVM